MKIKEWLKMFLSGMAMGAANAVPGVSGGTVAVILKIYQKIVDSISGIFKHFLKSLGVLLPLIIGIAAAMIPCLFLFDFAFEYFAFGLVSFFAGLIIGSFPGIIDEVKNEPVKISNVTICVFTCLIAISLGVLSVVLGDKIDIGDLLTNPKWYSYVLLIIVGFLASISLIIPGISGSMVLLVLGFYGPVVDLVTNALKNIGGAGFGTQVLEMLSLVLGIIFGLLSVAKLMGYLLNKHRVPTYYGIIGFILGSLVTLYINQDIWSYYQLWSGGNYYLPIWLEIILSVLLLAGGATLTYMLVRYTRKHKQEVAQN